MKIKTVVLLSFILTAGPVSAGLVESNVTVEDLPSFSLDTLGSSTLLSTDIWQQSDEETLFQLIDKIGTTPLTPASKKALILLLTQDTTGYQTSSQKSEVQNPFLVKRLEALFRLAAFDEVLSLINSIPKESLSDEIIKIKILTLLMVGNLSEAEELINNTDFSLFTTKARINLFLEKEERNKAILSYEIYKESQDKSDELFMALAENVLLEIDTPLPNETLSTPEHIFLLSRLKNKDIDFLKQAEPIRKTLIQLPSVPIETRILLAESIQLPATELSKIYTLPLFDIKIDKDYLKRAELYQKIQKTTNQNEKEKLLNDLLQSAFKDKKIFYLAPLFEEELNKIIPMHDNISLAFPAVQIYALQGNLEKAYSWYQLLKESNLENHQKEQLMLIPILQNLGAGLPTETATLIYRFCTQQNEAFCSPFFARLDPSFDVELNINRTSEEIILPTEYLKKENKLKTGENLLRAIFDLNDEAIKDKKQIIDFIKTTSPQTISKDIVQEGLIYQ